MSQSHVFAGVGGYYGTKDKSGKAGIFRRAADAADWDYVLGDLEAFTVFVHPRDANLVFAGTNDGVYRSTDRGATFKRTNFPDKGVQIWSFMVDPADPKTDARRRLAGLGLSQRRRRRELEAHAQPGAAAARQDAVRLPRDALRAAIRTSPTRFSRCWRSAA